MKNLKLRCFWICLRLSLSKFSMCDRFSQPSPTSRQPKIFHLLIYMCSCGGRGRVLYILMHIYFLYLIITWIFVPIFSHCVTLIINLTAESLSPFSEEEIISANRGKSMESPFLWGREIFVISCFNTVIFIV